MVASVNQPRPQIICRALRQSAATLGMVLAHLSTHPAALAQTEQTLSTLTNAQQVIDLGGDGARRNPHPVRLRAVITYPSPTIANRVYVQDATAGIQVAAQPLEFRAIPGQLVEVEGIAAAGPFYNYVKNAKVRLAGTAPLPRARPVSGTRLAAGADFAQWVSLQAVVRDVAIISGRLWLHASADADLFLTWVTIAENPTLPIEWAGALVELQGIPWTLLDDANKPAGFRFHVPGTNYIKILRPGSTNLFERPSSTAAELRARAPSPETLVKVAGVVTHASPAGLLALQDETGAIRAQALRIIPRDEGRGQHLHRSPPARLVPGDRIELVGAAVPGRSVAPLLLHAEYRLLAHEAPPAPKKIPSAAAASGAHDGQLVRLQGRLIDRTTRRLGSVVEQSLWLQDDGRLFEAVLQGEELAALPIEPDSWIEATGVCSIQPGELREVRSFRLYLRDPSDARVRSQPGNWLSGVAVRVLALCGIVVMLVLGWVALLRRQVRQRTADLQTSAESLRESEERFSKAFRASNVMLAILDATNGRYVDVNDAFLKTYGFARDEVIGRTSLELNLWQDPAQRAQVYRLYEQQGFFRDFESHLRTRAGERKVVLQSGDLIPLGHRPCLLSVGVDITHRKQAEAGLLQTLERERELNALKSSFVSMVSHEFRTPLEVILSSADILDRYLERLIPSERRQHLQSIQQSVIRMAGMMEEVLLLGRLEAGFCDRDDLHLAACCRRFVEEMRSASSNICPIELIIADFDPVVCADESLLRHILTNLISNAVKYSAPGSPVRVRIDREGNDAVFRVEDQGCGIPLADQPRIFQAFHRGGNVGTVPGTGLGLIIVQRGVSLHGGTIAFTSIEGKGTSFTVRLPLFSDSNSL